MKSWIIVFFATIAVFLIINTSHGISGNSVAYVNITNTLTQQSQTSAISSVEYTFLYNGSGKINLTLPDYASNIKLFLAGQPYDFDELQSKPCNSLNSSQLCVVLEIDDVRPSDIFTLSYSFNTDYSGGTQFNSTFAFTTFNLTTTYLKIITVLPQGAGLLSYSPKPATINLTGQNKEVIWSRGLSSNSQFLFAVSYSDVFSTQSSSQPLTSYIIAGAIIAGIIVALFILIRSKGALNPPRIAKKRTNPFRKLLNEDEEKVLKMIKPSGFTAQKDLVTSSGFSKSKMSKILSKLSRFKLIKLQSIGKNNKIKRI